MDPNKYYNYAEIKTAEGARIQPLDGEGRARAAEIKVEAVPEVADDTQVVYSLENLPQRRFGNVLLAGFGTPLKAAVKAAAANGCGPLFTTGTEDKIRAFSFAGTAQVVTVGAKFDERLFSNDYAVLSAAKTCSARTVLWAQKAQPSQLLRNECARAGILLLTPFAGDKQYELWQLAAADAAFANNGEGVCAVQEPIWSVCPHCRLTHDRRGVKAAGWVCPTCGKLYRMTTTERIEATFDAGSWEEDTAEIAQTNPLDFPDFDGVIERARKKSGFDEGVRTGVGRIGGVRTAAAVMEPTFMMGSLGSVVGEKITRIIERATAQALPVVIFCCSGGARMQEGLASLMQMAKVSAALEAHDRAGQLYISVITDPTTGGVTASFATLGDIILAEPEALLGFAGRRVIQNTIKQTLPDDFQSAEFALEHGQIDAIVPRMQLPETLCELLKLNGYQPEAAADEANPCLSVGDKSEGAGAQKTSNNEAVASGDLGGRTKRVPHEAKVPVALSPEQDCLSDCAPQICRGGQASATSNGAPEPTASTRLRKIVSNLAGLAESAGAAVSEQTSNAGLWLLMRSKRVADTPNVRVKTSSTANNHAWESVQLARNPKRPTSAFYINNMVDNFIELHGDRAFADDCAILAGLGRIDGMPVTIISEEKGADLKGRIKHNFGCPQPEGYRKAMRLMRQAEKFGRPIVCLVDTQGAYCGKEAEERGMGGAISESLRLMAGLTVPVVTVVLGEGGSGGALALAVANKVAMQENAVYSVLSPEGFASILWKDGSRAPEAAEVMKMSAQDALELGIIEDVIPEGEAAAHLNPDQAAAGVWAYIANALRQLEQVAPEELRQQRYNRFRKF